MTDDPPIAPIAEFFSPEVLREYALLADGERGVVIGPRGECTWMRLPRWDGTHRDRQIATVPVVLRRAGRSTGRCGYRSGSTPARISARSRCASCRSTTGSGPGDRARCASAGSGPVMPRSATTARCGRPSAWNPGAITTWSSRSPITSSPPTCHDPTTAGAGPNRLARSGSRDHRHRGRRRFPERLRGAARVGLQRRRDGRRGHHVAAGTRPAGPQLRLPLLLDS